MTKYILSIDPGLSTGVALISYEEDRAPELVDGWQFGGGVSGLKKWIWENMDNNEGWNPWEFQDLGNLSYVNRHTLQAIVSEKFTARFTTGFSYTTASLEPLRCEGLLIGNEMMPDYEPKEKRWRDPSLQYLVGGKDKADKKKRQHAFLKDSGFYRTGSMLGSKDADDFRSATAQGLAYLAREVGHKPTFDLIRNWEAQ